MVEHGLGEAMVLKLTEKIEHIGCQVYVDNFFNSPSLQMILLQKRIYCAGTVRTNRKLLPKKEVTADKDMKRGEVASYEASGITYVKWMDKKPVRMLSNFLSAHPLHEVKRRKKGSKEHEKVCCPNDLMGGIDLMDQKKVTYQFKHRSKFKYCLRVVFDMFDIAIVNSHIIYSKPASSSDGTQAIDSKTFRRTVAQSLIGNFNCRKRAIPSSLIMTQQKRLLASGNTLGNHAIEKTDERKRCKLCTSKTCYNRTLNAVFCYNRTLNAVCAMCTCVL